ncbi:UdgX family uracil-DNA binding protein [Spirillospora sp. CA-294931]|uniref:UdgX family uracil-DNA binding protein n=1 Tax=Spirillospora sp. CA-294931 TaxID=3240042 RepID=UPI003D8F228B
MGGAEEYVPEGAGLSGLRKAAADCRGCSLYKDATQTVFGEGAAGARVVLVGEQPGDQEDRKGAPFVGPAGRLLDKALDEAGIERGDAYVTNAVKHFKFTRPEGGKRRIHEKPGATEVKACRPWLVAELAVIDPDVVVALGATAAKALVGPDFRVTKQRGEPVDSPDFGRVVATVHPSSVLRSKDRDDAYAALVADLKAVARLL